MKLPPRFFVPENQAQFSEPAESPHQQHQFLAENSSSRTPMHQQQVSDSNSAYSNSNTTDLMNINNSRNYKVDRLQSQDTKDLSNINSNQQLNFNHKNI